MGTEKHADDATTMQRSGLAGLSIFSSGRAVPAETAMPAAGVATSVGGASANWQGEIWASSVGLVDALIRTYYGIYEFTDDPECVLRVGLGQARAAMTLSDGTRVKGGELIGTLHFWNEHLPRYTAKRTESALGRFNT